MAFLRKAVSGEWKDNQRGKRSEQRRGSFMVKGDSSSAQALKSRVGCLVGKDKGKARQ